MASHCEKQTPTPCNWLVLGLRSGWVFPENLCLKLWALEDIHLQTPHPPDLQMEMSEPARDFSLL